MWDPRDVGDGDYAQASLCVGEDGVEECIASVQRSKSQQVHDALKPLRAPYSGMTHDLSGPKRDISLPKLFRKPL